MTPEERAKRKAEKAERLVKRKIRMGVIVEDPSTGDKLDLTQGDLAPIIAKSMEEKSAAIKPKAKAKIEASVTRKVAAKKGSKNV